MKIFSILLAGMLMLACESKDPALSESLTGADVSRTANEVVTLTDQATSTTFSVSVLTIEDSRCPSDVVCIQGGWAEVSFDVNNSGFALRAGQSHEFSSNDQHFKLTLKDVTPYPSKATADEKKKAVFVVESI